MTAFANDVDLLGKRRHINHHTISYDANTLLPKNSGRYQMQHNLFPIDDKRVSSVGSPLKTDDHVGLFSQQIDDLSFSLVAPLRANHDNIRHLKAPFGAHP